MTNEEKGVKDRITFEESMTVIRFKGSMNIKEMMRSGRYIEAFAHAQLGIEKILWDKILRIFEPNKARSIGETINQSKLRTRTMELIKWAQFLGAISKEEYADLVDFNRKRNRIMNIQGHWWNVEDFQQALQKGIRFLEKNMM